MGSRLVNWMGGSPLSPPNFDGSASYFAAGESRSEIKNIGNPNKLCIPGILVDVLKEPSVQTKATSMSQRQNIFQIWSTNYIFRSSILIPPSSGTTLFPDHDCRAQPLSKRTDRSNQAIL